MSLTAKRGKEASQERPFVDFVRSSTFWSDAHASRDSHVAVWAALRSLHSMGKGQWVELTEPAQRPSTVGRPRLSVHIRTGDPLGQGSNRYALGDLLGGLLRGASSHHNMLLLLEPQGSKEDEYTELTRTGLDRTQRMRL